MFSPNLRLETSDQRNPSDSQSGTDSSFLKEVSSDLTEAPKGVGRIQSLCFIYADTKCCTGNILNGLLWIWDKPIL